MRLETERSIVMFPALLSVDFILQEDYLTSNSITFSPALTIYVHPALCEPFGLAVVEAAQAGCALVLSEIAPLRENWEGAALFFGSGGHGVQLVEVLHQLIQSPTLLAQFQR